MYQTDRKYITPEMKMSALIFDNPLILLLMEHSGLDFIVHDKTVMQLCEENKISEKVFVTFANLYNGFNLSGEENFSNNDIADIITYLKNSHNYYENEKYPEIKKYIQELYSKNTSPEIKLIDKFFNEYFEEVKEHLSYENRIAFPYFNELLRIGNQKKADRQKTNFSVDEYSEHHTDIESKLTDLKELLLKYVPVQNDRVLRRKIVVSLFELEYDLNVHSIIEETVLMPLIGKLEKSL
ncbi:MAG: hemerythrin domain-containing protein [Ignavibacteriales bacterium]|nr:hemerythrin domain-containing protein [Ignavibacteriales bacterium]